MKKRPLNILRLITWLPVGGIERKILAVLPRLNRDLFRVRLVCLRELGALAPELEKAGVPVDLCPMRTRLSPSGLWNLAQYMKHHQIDLVHAHMYRAALPGTIAARLAGVPVVVSQVHNVNSWDTARQRWQDRLLCHWRNAVVAVSECVRQDVLDTLHLPEEKVRVIYNGVDLATFSNRSVRDRVRAELGFSPQDIVVIYHGRLVPQKNPEFLVRIARDVTAPTGQTVKVLVVGDGSSRAAVEEAARSAGVTDRMSFLGRRDDVPDLLQAADLAVLPSFKEGFSNALVESLAAGLPTVATRVGGNAEAIETGQSGLIVPPHDDPAALAALQSLVNAPEERLRMAQAARQRAERFSLDRMVADVENLYLELAEKAGL